MVLKGEKTWIEDETRRDPFLDQSLVTDEGVVSSASLSRPAPESFSDPATGSLIAGRYKILRKLGQGGFGAVFLAIDQQLSRRVAVKCNLRMGGRASSLLRDEARAIAALNHPGIVSIFDLLDDPQVGLAIVMEFVEGINLRQLLSQRKLSPVQSAHLLRQMCDALAHAHSRRLIHRDLKPSNVLIGGDNQPMLTDFGLAVGLQDGAGSAIAGTPRYMAPEQLLSESHRIDFRTDVWGLGVIFYEMLTGSLPFTGEDQQEIFRNTLWHDPLPPRKLNSKVSTRLEQICLKALRKRMADRYQSISELRDELSLWLADAPASGELEDIASAGLFTELTPSSSQSSVNLTLKLTIAPKGLRPFDEDDSSFYMDLVPGPRHQSGLPESVVYWKNWIECTGEEPEDRVGVLYGPSGAGKSSFVRAALLPQLEPGICPIYIECADGRTEERLRAAVAEKLRGIEREETLRQQIGSLREQIPGDTGYRKAVLVLDQFESWYSTASQEARQLLAEAIRQCDGKRVQCLVIARDDFWMGVTEFMQWVEAPLHEGHNIRALERMDLKHAARVFEALGRAYGRLPDIYEPLTDSHREFIDLAVAEIAEGEHVLSVHLAMFAHMVRSREWSPEMLQREGGATGAAMEYLQQNFDRQTAPPSYRRLLNPVASTLARLLPPPDGQVRHQLVSDSRLRQHAVALGYADQLPEVLRVLVDDLKLVTPVKSELEDAAGELRYHLAHDFLAAPVRMWVDTVQKSTWQGRAAARLRELSEIWDKRRSRRWYPTLLEYIAMRLGTRGSARTEEQVRFLRAAGRYHATLVGIAAFVLLLIGSAAGTAYHQHGKSLAAQRQHAAAAVDLLLHGPLEEFPQRLKELSSTNTAFAEEFAEPWQDSVQLELRMRARLTLAQLGKIQPAKLVEDIPEAPADFFALYYDALRASDEDPKPLLRSLYERGPYGVGDTRAAILLLYFGDDGPARKLLEFRPDERDRSELIEQACTWRDNPAPWSALAQTAADSEVIYGASLVLGSFPAEVLQPCLSDDFLKRLYESPKAQLHSTARWLATHLGREPFNEPLSTGTDAEWKQTCFGFELVNVPAGAFEVVLPDEGGSVETLSNPQQFWISSERISGTLYQQYLDETKLTPSGRPPEPMMRGKMLGSAEPLPGSDFPASGLIIYDAMDFCNWLSRKAGLEPAYKFLEDLDDADQSFMRSRQLWELDDSKDGFRLPTPDQFRYAVHARSTHGQPWLVKGPIYEAAKGPWDTSRPAYLLHTHACGPNRLGIFAYDPAATAYVFKNEHKEVPRFMSVNFRSIVPMVMTYVYPDARRCFHVALPGRVEQPNALVLKGL